MDEIIHFIHNNYPSAQNLEELEGELCKLEQVNCPVTHRFSEGLYIRELFMPAGTVAVGHFQNFRHYNVMLKGRVVVLNADGSKTELVAPYTFTAEPGRKIGYVLEDMVWQNVYPTTETDIDKLEKKYITKSETWKLCNEQKKELKRSMREYDRNDFLKMLEEVGVKNEYVIEESENEADQISIKVENLKFKVDESEIQGKGIFATADIKAGEIISLARFKGFRTDAGRFTNHSHKPNAFMKNVDGNIFLVADRNITGCVGGELGEEITIDYRQAISIAKEEICQQ